MGFLLQALPVAFLFPFIILLIIIDREFSSFVVRFSSQFQIRCYRNPNGCFKFKLNTMSPSDWDLPAHDPVLFFTVPFETLVHFTKNRTFFRSPIEFRQKCAEPLKQCHPSPAKSPKHLVNVFRVLSYKRTCPNCKIDPLNA